MTTKQMTTRLFIAGMLGAVIGVVTSTKWLNYKVTSGVLGDGWVSDLVLMLIYTAFGAALHMIVRPRIKPINPESN